VGKSFYVCDDIEKECPRIRRRQGELRYREFVPNKQKNGDHKIWVAEIHLSRIAKLDRAEKRDSDEPLPSWA
jgi:hypothetical protein